MRGGNNGYRIIGIIWLSLFVLPNAYGQAADVDVWKAVRDVGGKRVVTYYAPELAAIRQEQGDQILIIDMKGSVAFSYNRHGDGDLRYWSFAELFSADGEIDRYAKALGTVQPHFSAYPPINTWQTASYSRQDRPDDRNPCYGLNTWRRRKSPNPLRVVNSWGGYEIMCVIKDAKVKQLMFVNKYYDNMPNELKRTIEGSDELFLYSKGIIPVLGKRRGRSYRLVNFSTEKTGSRFFAKPKNLEARTYDRFYQRSYADKIWGLKTPLPTAKAKK